MTFLKENLFLIVLGAVVLVACGTLLYMASSATAANAEQIQKRIDLHDELTDLRRQDIRNERQIEAQRFENQNIRADAERVRERNIEWNSRNYRPIQLDLYERDVFVETIPAFPIDEDKYSRFGGRLLFTTEYVKRMGELRESLDPVEPYTAEELTVETARQERRLEREHQLKVQREIVQAEERAREAGESVEGIAERIRQEMGKGDFGARAEAIARNRLQTAKAREGKMYVPEAALDLVFPVPVDQARDTRLWMAQLNLWITTDLVAAIRQTVDEAFGDLPPEKRNLLNSAVRHLVRVEIPEDYVGGLGAGGYMGDPAGGRGGRGDLGGRGGADRDTAMMAAAGAMGSATLTKQSTTKEYEVMHYSFSVVMPIEHIFRLQENLLERNLHTVLRIEISDLQRRGDADQRGAYYYGQDMVAQVTFYCELLTFSAWTRGTGTVEDKTLQWRRPPLMPREVLRTMIPRTIRRGIDNARLRLAG
jgi:hypothetical protein